MVHWSGELRAGKRERGGEWQTGGEIQTWLPPSLSALPPPPPPPLPRRFDQYESFDSRQSSLASSRDLYRSSSSGSYGYGDNRGDSMLLGQRGGSGFGGGVGLGLGGGGGYDSPSSSYGVAKMRQNMRDSFGSGQGAGSGGGGWVSAGRRSPRRGGNAGGRGAGGGFGSRKPDPTPLGGGGGGGGGRGGGLPYRGHSPGGGRGKLPSLLSNRMYPESGGFHQGSGQGPHDFPGRHFGGGPRAGRQRGRKRPLNRVSTSSGHTEPPTLERRGDLCQKTSIYTLYQLTGQPYMLESVCNLLPHVPINPKCVISLWSSSMNVPPV